MNTKKLLLEIVGRLINENSSSIAQVNNWSGLISLAKAHGVLQCVAHYVSAMKEEHKPNKDICNYLSNVLLQENMRSVNQLYAVDGIQKKCEEYGICNLVVKGAVTKNRYRDPVFRSMSDIDILYKSEQHKDFKETMLSLGYTDYSEGRKNDTYTMPPFISVEAHRSLLANESEYYEYYSDIWDKCLLKDGCKYTYEMRLEDEFIFNVIHLAEHFRHGGVGIRFIMDVFVYDNLDFDRDYFENELRKLNLYDFFLNISALARYWFSDGQSTDLIEKLSDFVLSNGVFGTKDNEAALYVSKGRFSFFLRTCFPKYDDMKSMFVWLEGKRYLLPYAWILRVFNSLRYRKHNVKAQFLKAKTGDKNKGKELLAFYNECGLK